MKKSLLALCFLALLFTSCGKDNETAPPIKVTGIILNKTMANLTPGGSEQLSVTGILPSDATDKSVVWSSNTNAVATVDQTGLVSIAVTAADGTSATITATAKDGSGKSASCAVTVSGVLINGVVWATCNVDAVGTFAAKPEVLGMFYQWNRKKAWPATGTVSGWDATCPSGDVWNPTNDPSPAGWRLPTKEEQSTLLDAAKVDKAWTSLNGVNGYKFTDKTSGNSIFLPVAGFRDITDGSLNFVDEWGHYWSGVSSSTNYAWYLVFGIDATDNLGHRTCGFSVRCVR